MIEKPAYGSPCTHCGKCCEDQICPLGVHVLGQKEGPCPALQRDADGHSSCGLVVDPRHWSPTRVSTRGVKIMREAAAILIGSTGICDALTTAEPQPSPELREATIAKVKATPRVLAAMARTMWGIR